MMKDIYFLLFFVFSNILLYCQDIHFSQFNRAPTILNPANTGLVDYDARFSIIYRNQWSSIPVAYNSLAASYEQNLNHDRNLSYASIGSHIIFDRAGDSKYTTLIASMNGAYHLNLNSSNSNILSLGLSINLNQRNYNIDFLKFDNQFNGDYYDPNIPIEEQFDKFNLSFIDFGLGVDYNLRFPNSLFLNFGGSIQHLNRTNQLYLKNSQNSLLNYKINTYFINQFNISEKLELSPMVFYQYQDEKYEILIGGSLIYNISEKYNNFDKISFGLNYRLNDAIIPWIKYNFDKSSFQLSYDSNVSRLSTYTNSFGGIELSFSKLLFYNKQDNHEFKYFCPHVWY